MYFTEFKFVDLIKPIVVTISVLMAAIYRLDVAIGSLFDIQDVPLVCHKKVNT